ncbi:MAG: hypothetical protein WBG73_05865 [Coleofasciculaceae cyanobacterium]
MSQNLITSGLIHAAELPIEEIRQQVATYLNIPLSQIERVECWKYQIWVKIRESRAKFISYRCLPLWIEKGIEVIKTCTTKIELDELGEILRTERDWYDAHKMPEAVQPWRDTWAQRAKELREEEERLQPILERQLAADAWYASWQGVLNCCRDMVGIQRLEPEIKHQSQDFVDLPEVVQAMQQLVQQRWQEIGKVV